MVFCISPFDRNNKKLLGILERVHVPEITGRSSGAFDRRSTSASDPHTNEVVPENTHHGASEDANQKGLTLISHWLYTTLIIYPK